VSKGILRVFSIVLLLSVFFMFSGVSSTFFYANSQIANKSCCNNCEKESNKKDNCSTPDCPAFLCLSIDFVKIFSPQIFFNEKTLPKKIESQNIKFLEKSIFHPPAFLS
jgi:hypothetical protein